MSHPDDVVLDGWTLVDGLDGLGEFLASVGADCATWVDADPAALAADEARVAADLAALDALEAAEETAVSPPTLTVVPDPGEPPPAGAAEHDRPPPEDDRDLTFAELCLPVSETPPERLPALLERDDGETILYAGRFTSIYGEPAGGKSWAALIVALEAIRRGGRVAYWDHEDRPSTVAVRAQLLGGLDAVTDPDRFRFVSPELADYLTAKAEAIRWLLAAPDPTYSLVVIDSAESAGCPSDGADVGAWLNGYVEPWRRRDIATVVVDHVPKRRSDRPPGAIGSQHKRARIDGAALLAIGSPWTKTGSGAVTLVVEKDRVGDLPAGRGQAVATIRGDYDPHGAFGWRITAPQAAADDGLDRRLLAAVAEAGEAGLLGTRGIREVVGGNGRTADAAAERLLQAGLIDRAEHGRGYVYFVTDDGLAELASEM